MSLCFPPKLHFSSSFVKLCEKNNTGIIARTNQIAVFSHVTTVTLQWAELSDVISHVTDD